MRGRCRRWDIEEGKMFGEAGTEVASLPRLMPAIARACIGTRMAPMMRAIDVA